MLSTADLNELRLVAAKRWPSSMAAGDAETWSEWARSLGPWEFGDVMGAVVMLGETSERFPSLAQLIAECRAQKAQRLEPSLPALEAPRRPARRSPGENVAVAAAGTAEYRRALHRELDRYAERQALIGKALSDDELMARHLAIDAVGPTERMAIDLMRAGGDPGLMARDLLESVGSVGGR